MKNLLFITFAFRFLGIGARNVKSNARLSLLGAAFGIGISIVPLVVTLVVSDGMISGIAERTVELGTGEVQLINVQPSSFFKNCENELSLKNMLKSEINDSYFLNAWVQREGHGLLVGKNARSGGVVRAIESSFFTENKKAEKLLRVIDGKPLLQDDKAIVLGEKIAEKLGLSVGDTCRLITLKDASMERKVPKVSIFRVEAIISSGYQELDALWIFIPLKKGMELISASSSLDSVVLSTENAFDSSKFSLFLKEVELKISFHESLPSTFSIYTWKELNKGLFYSFSTTKNLILFIVFLITLVASINISQALIMLVMERKAEIAILKANGASSAFIVLSFLTAGFITSFLGLLIGMPIGILISLHINEILGTFEKMLNYMFYYSAYLFKVTDGYSQVHLLDPAYYLEHIPVSLNFGELYFIAIITLLLSIIVSIIPSLKAGREKPLSIMRKI